MDKLRSVLAGKDADTESEQGILTEVQGDGTCQSLTWSTRLKGFAICFIFGILLSVLGSVCVFLHKITLFGVLFTAGNVLSLASTCFLMGPIKQIKKMFAPTRAIATAIVLVTMVLTLCAGFWWRNGALAILFCVLQYLAMVWYSLSYIPFARNAVTNCVGSCLA